MYCFLYELSINQLVKYNDNLPLELTLSPQIKQKVLAVGIGVDMTYIASDKNEYVGLNFCLIVSLQLTYHYYTEKCLDLR